MAVGETWVVVASAVYIQAVLGPYASRDEAIDAAKKAAGNDVDDHHMWSAARLDNGGISGVNAERFSCDAPKPYFKKGPCPTCEVGRWKFGDGPGFRMDWPDWPHDHKVVRHAECVKCGYAGWADPVCHE